MEKDFLILDAVAIQIGSDYCDLHNDFDLSSLRVDFADRTLHLWFSPAPTNSSATPNKNVSLSFYDIDYLSVSSALLARMTQDVVEIGYKNPDDFDHDWLIRESQATSADHLFIRFSGDEFIRVHSKVAVATHRVLEAS